MSLSIIIPTFNEASLIERTLQSLKQQAGNAEIVVVDGSGPPCVDAIAQTFTIVYDVEHARPDTFNIKWKFCMI